MMSVTSKKLFARACIPPGMDMALEGLTREVLKEQPRDLYSFAARHFEKLVKLRDMQAHNASLSPSSTQASENAGLIPESPTDPKKELLLDDDLKVITSPPTTLEALTPPVTDNGVAANHATDSNGASKTGTGLGIAALAATTGTVAILGATADTTIDALEDVVQVGEDVKEEVEMVIEDVEDVVKNASVSASPVTEDKDDDQEVLETSQSTSPTPKELEVKEDEATISPIQEDENQTTSGKESSLSTTEKQESVPTSPEPTKETSRTESVNEEEPLKDVSRPTSAIVSEILTESIPEDDDEPFPAPPPPEDEALESSLKIDNISNILSESASRMSDSKEEAEILLRNRRSTSELETTEDQRPASAFESLTADENEFRPASIVDIESKTQSRADSTVEPEKDLEAEIDLAEVDHKPRIVDTHEIVKENSQPPSRLGSAIEKKVEETNVDVEHIQESEVSEKSRPESVEAIVIEAAVEQEDSVAEETESIVVSVSPVIELQDEVVVPEDDILQTIEQSIVESVEEIVTADVETIKPIEDEKPENEKPAEDNIPEEDITSLKLEQASTELAKNAATTIQATFRGHQTRKSLRKVADNDNVGEQQTPPEPNVEQEINITESIEEEPTEEDVIQGNVQPSLEDNLKEIGTPLLNDTDNDLVDSLTVNDEKEQSVAPESIDELTSTDGKDEVEHIINVIINPERLESETEESDKISEDKSREQSTVPAESEPESLDAFVNDVNRAVSNISESTVSVGDSISALRGSETDSVNALSVSEDLVSHVLEAAVEEVTNVENRKESAATTIQASVRGFQARKKMQKTADEPQLPVPEPIQDFLPEDPTAPEIDDDELPPPPDDCDIEPPPPEVPPENDVDEEIASVLTDLVNTPRSPETGEKLKSAVESLKEELVDGVNDLPPPIDPDNEEAIQLALLQRPQECDELPENRWETEDGEPRETILPTDDELRALQRPQECDELPEHRGELVNGDVHELSSVEVDDSSLSSAATKIQAGARGFLTRKHMKDTFSTTAPSITDSQQSIGAALTSQDDDDAVQTSGSLETEVQRLSLEEQGNVGVTAVVISNINGDTKKSLENGTLDIKETIEEKALSLDSQLHQEKKVEFITSASVQDPIVSAEEDQKVWQTLQDELEEAATKIQSNFRGFSTRQRLHRENAVHMPTISSVGSSEKSDNTPVMRSSGEFHDMMVLPPVTMLDKTSVNDDAMANCQQYMSETGKPHEGHVISNDVTPSVSHRNDGVAHKYIINMGEATEAVQEQEVKTTADMKGDNVTNAATKIQAGFRGYKVRKQMRQVHADDVKKNGPKRRRSSHTLLAVHQVRQQDKGNTETTLQDRSATKIQAGIRGFLVRKRRREEKDAAVKIQAGFRGYKVRRDRKSRAPVEK